MVQDQYFSDNFYFPGINDKHSIERTIPKWNCPKECSPWTLSLLSFGFVVGPKLYFIS